METENQFMAYVKTLKMDHDDHFGDVRSRSPSLPSSPLHRKVGTVFSDQPGLSVEEDTGEEGGRKTSVNRRKRRSRMSRSPSRTGSNPRVRSVFSLSK